MDEIFEQGVAEFKLKWDHEKDWKKRIHLGVGAQAHEVQGGKGKCGVPTGEETNETTPTGEKENSGIPITADPDVLMRTSQHPNY